MKFTVDDIKGINPELLNIRVHCNKGVLLDYYLVNNLTSVNKRKEEE